MADPNKQFIVHAVIRGQIASDLNDFLDRAEFEDGDDRLTDAICTEYADALDEIEPDEEFGGEQDQALHELWSKTCKKCGVEPPS